MKKIKVSGYYLVVKEMPKGQKNITIQLHNKEGVLKDTLLNDRVIVEIEERLYNLPKSIVEIIK